MKLEKLEDEEENNFIAQLKKLVDVTHPKSHHVAETKRPDKSERIKNEHQITKILIINLKNMSTHGNCSYFLVPLRSPTKI